MQCTPLLISYATYLVKSFLSERISQDPLEKFFGTQRQRRRVHENPSVSDFIQNTQALWVANVFVRDTVKARELQRQQ